MADALELICPAGTLVSLRAAVDAGADAVYVGFQDETNARNFPGLNFSRAELQVGIAYAHASNCRVFLALNTFPAAGNPDSWHRAMDDAAAFGVDALILCDIGLLQRCAERYPDLRRHLSVQAAASNADAIGFYQRNFDIKRVVLPRVLSLADIQKLSAEIDIETEVFAFGGMCVMAEGRCLLSGYATGKSPNLQGVCSPASHVRFHQRDEILTSQLGDFTIDIFQPGVAAGYPTLCKGRFVVRGQSAYLFEEPVSLNTLEILPALAVAGVKALKIEGRQRGHSYVTRAVSIFRLAIDAVAAGHVPPTIDLNDLTEGACTTAGAYKKSWR